MCIEHEYPEEALQYDASKHYGSMAKSEVLAKWIGCQNNTTTTAAAYIRLMNL